MSMKGPPLRFCGYPRRRPGCGHVIYHAGALAERIVAQEPELGKHGIVVGHILQTLPACGSARVSFLGQFG